MHFFMRGGRDCRQQSKTQFQNIMENLVRFLIRDAAKKVLKTDFWGQFNLSIYQGTFSLILDYPFMVMMKILIITKNYPCVAPKLCPSS